MSAAKVVAETVRRWTGEEDGKKNDDAKCFRGNDGRRRRRRRHRTYPEHPLASILYLCTAAGDVVEKRERVACISPGSLSLLPLFFISLPAITPQQQYMSYASHSCPPPRHRCPLQRNTMIVLAVFGEILKSVINRLALTDT